MASIYEFHASHIADTLEKKLADGIKLSLVMARQTRDPSHGRILEGDFARAERFQKWQTEYQDRFERVFVPTGGNGLVATAYHIKAAVRDERSLWLSSGNWKRSSQPILEPAQQLDPVAAAGSGNREWHVIIDNETLAQRLRHHIKADYERSLELGGTLEAVEEDSFVDMPLVLLERPELEKPPSRVIEPISIIRSVRVKPLLTPDRDGAVYSEAVLQLIRSAHRQLVFQNQYIAMRGAGGGFLQRLVAALIEKSRELEDFRMILRREDDDLLNNLSALQRQGLDVNRCCRTLPKTHTKGMVVDGQQVLIGSHNWSSLGVTLNRDASLIFDDTQIAEYYLTAFEIDWDRALPFGGQARRSGETPRLAVGPEPPAGFVRMTLSEYLEG